MPAAAAPTQSCGSGAALVPSCLLCLWGKPPSRARSHRLFGLRVGQWLGTPALQAESGFHVSLERLSRQSSRPAGGYASSRGFKVKLSSGWEACLSAGELFRYIPVSSVLAKARGLSHREPLFRAPSLFFFSSPPALRPRRRRVLTSQITHTRAQINSHERTLCVDFGVLWYRVARNSANALERHYG